MIFVDGQCYKAGTRLLEKGIAGTRVCTSYTSLDVPSWYSCASSCTSRPFVPAKTQLNSGLSMAGTAVPALVPAHDSGSGNPSVPNPDGVAGTAGTNPIGGEFCASRRMQYEAPTRTPLWITPNFYTVRRPHR